MRRERRRRRVREHRGGSEPARRQPAVQPVNELHHVNRVEAQLHEARLHRVPSVARAVAQTVHNLRHHQLHAVKAERAAQRRLPLRHLLLVLRHAHTVLDQHAVTLVRSVLRSVPGHKPAHPRPRVQVEAQPAVAPLLHVVCVRAPALCRPITAARHAAHALHPRQLRLTQHEGAQHAAQAARARARHHAEQLDHSTARRLQARLRPPHRLAQHRQRSHALRVHGGEQRAVATKGDELAARLQLQPLPQRRLRRAQRRRVPLRLQLEQLRQVRERRQPEAGARRGHQPLQRDPRVQRVLRVAQQVRVGQQARVRQRELPVRRRHQHLPRPRLQRVKVQRRRLGHELRRVRHRQRVHLQKQQAVTARHRRPTPHLQTEARAGSAARPRTSRSGWERQGSQLGLGMGTACPGFEGQRSRARPGCGT